MSLRAYFAAHAPAEPQEWFVPVMSTGRPEPDHAGVEPSRREFVDPHNKHAIEAWDREQYKQGYIQWPLAWADEQIAQLNSTQPQHEEQPASVPQYVREAVAAIKTGLTTTQAREALGNIAQQQPSPATEQDDTQADPYLRFLSIKKKYPRMGPRFTCEVYDALLRESNAEQASPTTEHELPQGPFVIEFEGQRWEFGRGGWRRDMSPDQDGRDLARLALRCGGRIVKGGDK